MAEEGFKRKLAAILSADVEGYSRLMGEDEDATIRTLTAYRELMSTLIQKHRGRVVDSPGDNLLAEFLSVVDAVRCAVEIQEELRVRNAELPENRRMEFRIGINLGDVVEEGERIYGDGINITARVEGLAEGGGICISGTVYDSIKNKLSLGYESLGEHTVKNIKEPVRVYRMRIGPGAAASVVREEKSGPRYQRWVALAVVVIVVLAGAVASWKFYFRRPSVEPASLEKMAFSLPDKPSIAVLPFVNMSGDPEQDFISDGLTEDIISALSSVPDLFVIARNSTFTYKGKTVKVQQVAEELGVRYVLEGSFKRSGDKVRITAQLIDATTGHHLWAERYDREFKNLFALEDDITLNIMSSLQIELTGGQWIRLRRQETDNLEAWLLFNKGSKYGSLQTKESNYIAIEMYEKALKLDPNFITARVFLTWKHWQIVQKGWSESREESFKKVIELAQEALEMDPTSAPAISLMVGIHMWKREYDQALAIAQKTITLEPNNAEYHAIMGWVLIANMRPQEAIRYFKKAMRLSPYYPPWFLNLMIRAYVVAGQYDEAIAAGEEMLKRNPGPFFAGQAHINRAVSYSNLDQPDKARAETAKAIETYPGLTVTFISKELDCKDPAFLEHYYKTLRELGLPE
jgi:TolB-like protein/class 3 adenylate cyclase/Tfp pilus assembly protein PilF